MAVALMQPFDAIRRFFHHLHVSQLYLESTSENLRRQAEHTVVIAKNVGARARKMHALTEQQNKRINDLNKQT